MGRWPGERMMPRKRGREGWPLQLDSWGKKRKPWDSSGEICIYRKTVLNPLSAFLCARERGEKKDCRAAPLGRPALRMCARSYPALCNLMDYSLPGSSVHGILQARTLEWEVVLIFK